MVTIAGILSRNLPPEAVPLRNQRDSLCASDPAHPDLPALERQIRDVCDKASHEAFNKELSDTGYQTNSPKFANLVRRISGKHVYRPPNQPITFKSKTYTKRAAIAKKFNQQFTSIGPHKQLPITRKVLCRIRKKKLVADYSPFVDADVIGAIGRAKLSTAAGPDGIKMVHLKHLGPRAISYLTSIFNLSVCHSVLPSIWKQALILPVPKSGKPAPVLTSYRPISLLCPASKLLERCLLPLISPLPLSMVFVLVALPLPLFFQT